MVIISFSVLEDQILAGTKTRTMRPAVYAGKENTKWGRVYAKWIYQATPSDYHSELNRPMIPLQVYWKSRSAKIVGYHCGCGDILKKGEICMGCNTPAETPVRESYKMFDAVLVNITKKKLQDLSIDEWKLDGFQDNTEGFTWFSETYDLCLWADKGVDSARFHPEVLNFEVYIIEFRRV